MLKPADIYVLSLIVAAVVSGAVAIHAWRHWRVPGARPMVALMAAVVVWSLGNVMELRGDEVSTKVFWTAVEYFGIVAVPVAWFAMAVEYTGHGEWLTRRNLALLSIMPLTTLAMIWTNGWHGLMQYDIALDTGGPYSVLTKTYGPWAWTWAVYCYALILGGCGILVYRMFCPPRLFYGQVAVLVIGALLPLIASVMYGLQLGPVPRVDLTPISFAVVGIVLGFGFHRFGLFDIMPVAREAVIDSMMDAVVVMDAKDRVIDLNLAARELVARYQDALAMIREGRRAVGGDSEEGRGAPDRELLLGEGPARRFYEMQVSPLRDRRGRLGGRVVLLRDVTDRRWAEATIRRLAYHDSLTGLPNRALFEDRLEMAMARARRHGWKSAIIFVDMDDFKRVNDTMGHLAGDVVLETIGRRLKDALRESDTVCRYGGDEFLVLLPEVARGEDAMGVGQKLLAALGEPFVLEGAEIRLSASMGVALYPDHGEDARSLIRHADLRMYRSRVKASGSGSVLESD